MVRSSAAAAAVGSFGGCGTNASRPLRHRRHNDHEDDQKHQKNVDHGRNIDVGRVPPAATSCHCHGFKLLVSWKSLKSYARDRASLAARETAFASFASTNLLRRRRLCAPHRWRLPPPGTARAHRREHRSFCRRVSQFVADLGAKLAGRDLVLPRNTPPSRVIATTMASSLSASGMGSALSTLAISTWHLVLEHGRDDHEDDQQHQHHVHHRRDVDVGVDLTAFVANCNCHWFGSVPLRFCDSGWLPAFLTEPFDASESETGGQERVASLLPPQDSRSSRRAALSACCSA